jgi:hypothetical protein
MYKKKSIFYNLLPQTLIAIIFIMVAIWVILTAAGFKIEIKNRRLVQTSLIAVKSDPRDAVLSIDGQIQIGNSPWRVPNIVPGNHYIEVAKIGYVKWSKNIQLAPGETALLDSPLLFLEVPIAKELSSDEQSSLLEKINNIEQDSRIVVSDNELRVDSILVTRLSTNISQARFYQDENHISFVSGGWLHIIDIDGANDYTPAKMSDNDNYLFVDKGNTAIVKRGEKLESIAIR